jgi:hypothetical protein
MVETKDIQRLQDIQAQPGKEIGLATKQSKLIKDVSKAWRRFHASQMVFGGSHVVTNIFLRRYQELSGEIVVPTSTSTMVVETKTIEPQAEIPNRIKRSQQDFPVGCNVKIGEEKGKVVDHDDQDYEMVRVDFRDEPVSVYEIKRC